MLIAAAEALQGAQGHQGQWMCLQQDIRSIQDTAGGFPGPQSTLQSGVTGGAQRDKTFSSTGLSVCAAQDRARPVQLTVQCLIQVSLQTNTPFSKSVLQLLKRFKGTQARP